MIRAGLSVVILVSFCVPSFALQFTVAPDGHDANPGTKGRPFATLTHARDAVRQMKKNSKGTITVYLRGGTYYLPPTTGVRKFVPVRIQTDWTI